jgi:outer membrane protein assembly factor BamB
VRWRQRLDAPVSNLYVTSSGIAAVSGERIAVLDPSTGEVRAQLEGGRSAAVTGSGGLLTADEEGLTAHDLADGSIAWRSDLTGVGPPTVAGGTVYGISNAEVPQLVATDADTGQQLWQFPGEGAEPAFPAETAVAPADDFVYLADSEAVYGILPKGASVDTDTAVIDANEPAPEPLCVWKTEVDDDLWLPTLKAVSEGVVVADRSGNVCLRGFADGKAVWCVAIAGVADAQPTLLPSGDHVFVVTQTEVTAIDIGTGKPVWTKAGRYRVALLGERGQLVVVDERGKVSVVSAEGDIQKLRIEVALPAVLAIDGDVLYAAEEGGGVVSADLTQAGG